MKYTESHEWVKVDGNQATIGITDYAQKELGDIVYVELPTIGHQVEAGDEVVVLESTKAAVDVYAPVAGEISEVNPALIESPQKVNESPESQGWLFKLKIAHLGELEALMNESDYHEYIKQC